MSLALASMVLALDFSDLALGLLASLRTSDIFKKRSRQ